VKQKLSQNFITIQNDSAS